ncbi:hypothetical protein GGH13_000392 [Coemansia sp. S155-1]|nr:hypothetical protein GGH13_000392 [Coemansia sp. S155-1]
MNISSDPFKPYAPRLHRLLFTEWQNFYSRSNYANMGAKCNGNLKSDMSTYCNVAAIKLPTAVYRDHITSTRMKCAGSNGDKPVYASGAADLNRQIIPLVVNTQGWLKGLGLDLHYSPCESVKPTNQVQLYDSGSIPERSDEAREWSVGNGLVPTINLSGIKASDPRLVWISAMSYVRVKQMLNY